MLRPLRSAMEPAPSTSKILVVDDNADNRALAVRGPAESAPAKARRKCCGSLCSC
jgi:hypothetical protein